MTTLPDFAPVPADFDGSAFDDWIAGASVAKRSVAIYGKPGLYAEYEQLERDLELAKAKEEHGAELAGSDVTRIEARMGELYQEWVASKSTWIVHRLDSDQIKALQAAEPALVEPVEPKAPQAPELPPGATLQQQKSHTIAMQAHEKALAEHEAAMAAYRQAAETYATEMNLRSLAAAVERVEFADGRTSTSITVDQLRAMRSALGDVQVLKLVTAVQMAGMSEPEIPAPFSQSTSSEGPTS